jgi:hypothetical protein
VSSSKPSIASAVTITPAELAQRDLADLPMTQTRGSYSIRRITLGDAEGRVGVNLDVAGILLPEEIEDVLAELVAIREAARREQARQIVDDERAAEVEALAREVDPEELAGMIRAAEDVENASAVALYLDAQELQATYREDAKVELRLAAKADA